MTAVDPITSGMPSSTVTFPDSGPFARSKNSLQLVGRSLILSERYMNPVVPQSFGIDHLSSVSYGRPLNLGSRFFVTVGSSEGSIGSSRGAAAGCWTLWRVG